MPPSSPSTNPRDSAASLSGTATDSASRAWSLSLSMSPGSPPRRRPSGLNSSARRTMAIPRRSRSSAIQSGVGSSCPLISRPSPGRSSSTGEVVSTMTRPRSVPKSNLVIPLDPDGKVSTKPEVVTGPVPCRSAPASIESRRAPPTRRPAMAVVVAASARPAPWSRPRRVKITSTSPVAQIGLIQLPPGSRNGEAARPAAPPIAAANRQSAAAFTGPARPGVTPS